MELGDIDMAAPYLEMGVKHFCIGWDVHILHDCRRVNGEGCAGRSRTDRRRRLLKQGRGSQLEPISA